MDPDWNDFKVLLALGRGGSIAGAARVLEIDHSTVSRRLAAIEDAFGAKLLIRGGREFAWTDEGRTALAAAEAVESAISDATRCIQTAKSDAVGIVRVSVSPAFVPLLMPMLATEHVKHPQLDIQLTGDYRRADLAKGEADIAIRMSRPNEPSLIGRKVMDCAWCLYATSAYMSRHGSLSGTDKLPEHQLVLYAEPMLNIPQLRWLEDYRDTNTQFSRVDNLEICARMLSAGIGIGCLPCFIGDQQSDLVRALPDVITSNTGWIVYHESLRNTARVRTVVDLLVKFFDAERALFSGQRISSCEAKT